VGMLFDPAFIPREPVLVASALFVVLVVKPVAALAIVAVLGYPVRTGLTVALGLAQIGEFSFILAQVGHQHGLLSDDGRQVLVAAAMISITLNPLLFGSLDRIEGFLRGRAWLWGPLTARYSRRQALINAGAHAAIAGSDKPSAIIVGYGPVGRVVHALLRDAGLHTVVVDMNLASVQSLARAGHTAIYGDATRPEILEQAGVRKAAYLVLTHPHPAGRADIVQHAHRVNPEMKIILRARYLSDADALRSAGSTRTVFEEGETGIGMARQVLELRGTDRATIDRLLGALRQIWKMNP
jgi:monovalent cation:H+ antiporter-2, CPA2 family